MNLIRTKRTYATAAKAEVRLMNVLSQYGMTMNDERWMIAVAPDGRFAPVLVGVHYLQTALANEITVVS